MPHSKRALLCEMAINLILGVALVTVVNGDISNGRAPRNGSCLCFSGDGVNVRSFACGQRILGSANSDECYRYTGRTRRCSLNNKIYQFVRMNYKGKRGWSAGVFLDLESDSRCSTSRANTSKDTLSLTELYNSRVMKAERYERPLDFKAPKWIKDKLPNHCGVVVTLQNSRQRWLVHKGNEFGKSSETVVVSARHMSSDWSRKQTKSVRNSRVTDYVSAGGAKYSLLIDNCLHACSRMMNLS